VTNSAVPGIVSNGVTDWLYEGDYFIYIINPIIVSIFKINGNFLVQRYYFKENPQKTINALCATG
jgi:hypothetical protein